MGEKLGILGQKLSYSYSPALHRIIARHCGLDVEYRTFETESPGKFLKYNTGGMKGLNVTVPYKERCVPYADNMDDAVKAIGSANTLKFMDGSIFAYNTDWTGFLKSLGKKGFYPSGKSALILGAGGSAKAVIYALISAGIKSIFIYNRTPERGEKTANLFAKKKCGYEISSCSLHQITALIQSVDLIVNATSAGMGCSLQKPLTLEGPLKALVLDLIYNPAKTEFLKDAGELGAETLNGLDMLIFQAIESVKIWFEIDGFDITMVNRVKAELLREIR